MQTPFWTLYIFWLFYKVAYGHAKQSFASWLSVDIATAAIAKEALEGHCIYDGGYRKLRLSYSRHTDLNVKVHKIGCFLELLTNKKNV